MRIPPANIHLSIDPESVCALAARKLPSGELAAAIRRTFGELDPARLEGDTFQGLLAIAGVSGSGLPARMAEINEALNALPVPLREKLLVEYLNQLYQHREDA